MNQERVFPHHMYLQVFVHTLNIDYIIQIHTDISVANLIYRKSSPADEVLLRFLTVPLPEG